MLAWFAGCYASAYVPVRACTMAEVHMMMLVRGTFCANVWMEKSKQATKVEGKRSVVLVCVRAYFCGCIERASDKKKYTAKETDTDALIAPYLTQLLTLVPPQCAHSPAAAKANP